MLNTLFNIIISAIDNIRNTIRYLEEYQKKMADIIHKDHQERSRKYQINYNIPSLYHTTLSLSLRLNDN